METVGFIGLGNMGSGMAANIQKAGYPMVVHDIREGATKAYLEKGARLGSSPEEVAGSCEVIFTSLPGPKEVEAVAIGPDGIWSGIRKGSIYIDLSTSRPTLIRHMEPMFRERGAHVLDAPVSGGPSGAASGNLAVMVGGDQAIYEQVKTLLDSFGDKVFYAGAIGAGSVCKLVHNVVGYGFQQALAEGLTLGVKAGVEPRALWECVRRGALGRMSLIHEAVPSTVFTGEFDPAKFALRLARKDIGLATELAREFDVPMPFANQVEQIAVEGMNRGWGNRDSRVTILLQEEAAGVEVRVSGVDAEAAAKFISTHPDI